MSSVGQKASKRKGVSKRQATKFKRYLFEADKSAWQFRKGLQIHQSQTPNQASQPILPATQSVSTSQTSQTNPNPITLLQQFCSHALPMVMNLTQHYIACPPVAQLFTPAQTPMPHTAISCYGIPASTVPGNITAHTFTNTAPHAPFNHFRVRLILSTSHLIYT